MRFVKRSTEIPDGFEERARKEYNEIVAHRSDPSKTKNFTFKVYKRAEIKLLLQQMFYGKCAYCETFYSAAQPMDVEHYRPKGAVSEDSEHEGYWWLAMKWDNLLPSCIDCNRSRKQVTPKGDVRQLALLQGGTPNFTQSTIHNSGKKDSFPIADAGIRATSPSPNAGDSLVAVQSTNLLQEEPLLLNPCNDEPEKHLVHHFTRLPADTMGKTAVPVSFMLPAKLSGNRVDVFRGDDDLSLKGAVSIHVYGLNRLDLVQARTEILRRLEFLKTMIIQLHSLADEIEAVLTNSGAAPPMSDLLIKSSQTVRGLADSIMKEIVDMSGKKAPYASMVKAWLVQLKGELEA